MSKPAERTRLETISATILSEGMKKKIAAELSGKSINQDKFVLAAITAIRQNPALADCNAQSVYNAVTRAAHDGLLPDGREGVITIYNTNVGTKAQPQWEKHAQWNPMVYGIVQRLGKFGIHIDSQVVYEKDVFDQEFGDDPRIVHRPPKLGQDRGKPVGCYAIITLPDKRRYREVMDVETVEKIKEMSKNKEGVWVKWWDEMWRKSVIRRLSKRVPLPEAVKSAVESEDLEIDLDEAARPFSTEKAPAAGAPKLIEQIPSRTLQDVVVPSKEPVAAQPEGEVIEARGPAASPPEDDGVL